jgi:hypothetical protein
MLEEVGLGVGLPEIQYQGYKLSMVYCGWA